MYVACSICKTKDYKQLKMAYTVIFISWQWLMSFPRVYYHHHQSQSLPIDTCCVVTKKKEVQQNGKGV